MEKMGAVDAGLRFLCPVPEKLQEAQHDGSAEEGEKTGLRRQRTGSRGQGNHQVPCFLASHSPFFHEKTGPFPSF